MNEDKLLEKIKQSAESCEIPEGLKPEAIEVKLTKKPNPWRKRVYMIGGAAAAVLVILLLAVGLPVRLGEQASETETVDEAVTADTAAVMPEASGTGDETVGAKELDSLYVQAEDYEAVYDVIKSMIVTDTDEIEMEATEDSGISWDSSSSQDVQTESATAEVASEDMAGQGVSDYSDTNLQVEGVDEGDVVKTDGNYLYIIHENRWVRIVKIDGADMEETAIVRLDEDQSEESIQEIYLTGSTLNIISQGYKNGLEQKDEDTYYYDYNPITSVYTYDLSNPEKPKLTGHVSQDGNYNTSRKTGGYIYLFTDYYNYDVYGMNRDVDLKAEEVIPAVNDKMLDASEIYLPVQPQGTDYIVISSVNMEKPDEITDKKAIMGGYGQFYITTENIYIYNTNWNANFENTSIAKFHFEKGEITGESAGLVRGTITDTFAINEHNGYLRVLTSSWSDGEVNYVYVLDEKMNITGKIEGLAEGESIYSARFMGDIGYFVTYRQVDPLFSVDFSDPQNPEILGELKITGFSEYLHFYGKDRLLGIGWETDPDTDTRLGLKLSMFDISNPKDVKQVGKTVVENIDGFPGEYNYKALTVSPDKNVIGLVTTAYDSRGVGYSYMVFSYNEEKGFENQLTYTFASSNTYYGGDNENARGVYVNDTFYIVKGSEVLAFDMNYGYKKVGELLK